MASLMIWVLNGLLKIKSLWGYLLSVFIGAILGALLLFVIQKIGGKKKRRARNLALVIRNDLFFLRSSLKANDIHVIQNLANGIKSVSLWESLAVEATDLLPHKLVQSISNAYAFVNVALARGINIGSSEFQAATSQYFVKDPLSQLNKTIAELNSYCRIKPDNDDMLR